MRSLKQNSHFTCINLKDIVNLFLIKNIIFVKIRTEEGIFMRYIITTVWAVIFVEIIGFIGSKLTQMAFNPCESALIGAAFGLLFTAIIPTVAIIKKNDSKNASNVVK